MAEDESKDGASLEALVERLKGSRRRGRQEAAHEIAVLAKADPQSLVTYADDLVDALDRPEAQTRWEMLDALTSVTSVDASVVAAGFDGAEASLFDDGSAIVRLAAFKFLSCYGATSERASDAVWPLLDEAVQCYHGDPEYHDMLVSMLEFARGSLSEKSRDALAARVAFDAESGRGYIKAYSTEIAAAVAAARGQ
ncbi:conserved hypothetical protein [Olsenella uli DSM 7084]|uniref:HEAT repeat domain-containing protein n=1 Tax=Olsenella uli (strain ATCC 49627 / DSM 7084 / CCUG 31166 / CIP 109912 / JCM 12494 / LMG 11480 / NCIMB 702895 / VPI D76D-27C) TaxID=633147 RepID=E1QWM8_OLSUV|nr:hypothetical protein [Olsenella uli]ADK68531.1 conserved hypothetical protein [Olsenella uli DSM 7084]KRO12663.1 hypothetical protein IV77_GL000091 [Olsenella uli DSM 7084]